MVPIFRALIFLSCSILISNCSILHGGSRGGDRAGMPPPDVKLHIYDMTDGDYVFDAQISVSGVDSVQVTKVYLLYGLLNVAGKSIRLNITHRDYVTFDTSITVPDNSLKTIEIAMMSVLIAKGKPTETSFDYRKGWENAQKSIDSMDAYIYTSGGLRRDLFMIDEFTGLPIRGNMSCLVDDHILMFAKGHNDRIKLWISKEGVPVYSKKKWLSIIRSPKDFYQSSSKVQSPLVLVRDSGSLLTSDGFYRLELETVSGWDASTAVLRITSILTGEVHKHHVWDVKKPGKIAVVWGPKESSLAIVKTRSSYYAFDLRKCELLNGTLD